MVNASPLNLITCTRPRTQVTLGMARGREKSWGNFCLQKLLGPPSKTCQFFSGSCSSGVTCSFRKPLGCPTSPRYELIMSIKGVKKEVRPQWLDQAIFSAVQKVLKKQVFKRLKKRNKAMPLIRNSLMILMVTVVPVMRGFIMFHPLNSGLWGSY